MNPYTFWFFVFAIICVIVVFLERLKFQSRARLDYSGDLESDDDTSPILAQDTPQFFTIEELRRALLPGLDDEQYRELSVRISVRSAILAIRKMGLVPAKIDKMKGTPSVTGNDLIVFPGNFSERDNEDGLGNWDIVALGSESIRPGTYPIECDIYGGSMIAAVHPRSKHAGKFPPDYQDFWEKGGHFQIQTTYGTVEV